MEDLVAIVAILSHSTAFLMLMFGVVALAVLAAPLKRWIAMREQATAQATSEAAEKAAQYAAKTERLEQRMAVLERILTDRSANLAAEIEHLRDTPLN